MTLTPRENQLVRLLVETDCAPNKEIAHLMGITEGGVKVKLSQIRQKTKARSRYHLTVMAAKGLFDVPEPAADIPMGAR